MRRRLHRGARQLHGVAAAALLVAQTTAASAAPPAPRLQARYRHARIERNLGWVLAALGTAGAAAGGVATAYGLREAGGFDRPEVTGGVVALGAGIALLIPGIVLSLHGQATMTGASWRLHGSVGTSGAFFLAVGRSF